MRVGLMVEGGGVIVGESYQECLNMAADRGLVVVREMDLVGEQEVTHDLLQVERVTGVNYWTARCLHATSFDGCAWQERGDDYDRALSQARSHASIMSHETTVEYQAQVVRVTLQVSQVEVSSAID